MPLFNWLKKYISLAILAGFIAIAFHFGFPAARNLLSNSPAVATNTTIPTPTPALGIGLNSIADWSPELPFLNILKSTRRWTPHAENVAFDTNEFDRLDLDEQGWVKSLPNANDPNVRYRSVYGALFSSRYPGRAGRYVVLYEGEGSLRYNGAAKNETLSKPGRDVIDIGDEPENVLLEITTTDPQKKGNYIRNLAVVLEKYESLHQKQELFNPELLSKIKYFKTLRFMDWMAVNNSQQQEWSNRPKPGDYTWSVKGVPVEVMVALANQLKIDPWFTLPHLATDEYVTNFAKIVKERLDPKLKVYVEFSNEVWNWAFSQSHSSLEKGRARWGDRGDAFLQWSGMKTHQFTAIWKQVFGSQNKRVLGVISSQTGYRGAEPSVLDCSLWVAEGHEPCYKNADVFAITGYFGSDLGNKEFLPYVESWRSEPDGGFNKAFQQLEYGNVLPANAKDHLKELASTIQYFKKVADEKGLKMVAYEGGSHIVGLGELQNNPMITNFLIEVNRHPKMYHIYSRLLEIWQENGGSLFNHYVDVGSYTKYGSWGALEYLSQPETPKYKALLEFIRKNH